MTERLRDRIVAVEHAGECDAERYMTGGIALRACGLGRFSSGSRWSGLVLRRALLSLRLSPRFASRFRALVPDSRREAFDRFLTRHAYWTGVRRQLPGRDVAALVRGPVILMYHAIGRHGEEPSSYVVPAARFRRQMAWLKWSGFRVIPLADLVADLKTNRIPPRRSVVLTFDDGYADNWSEALPVLRRYCFPATVFVVSSAIGKRAWWPDSRALIDRAILDDHQIADLAASRVEIGAHSLTHRSLTELDPGSLKVEIAESRAHLEQTLGGQVRTFAYPFGDCCPQTIDEVARAGFDAACSSRSGIADPAAPLFALPRVEVRGTDSLRAFALLVWRGHRRSRAGSRTRLQAVAT